MNDALVRVLAKSGLMYSAKIITGEEFLKIGRQILAIMSGHTESSYIRLMKIMAE